MRIFPLSNWTEIDIWQYIHREEIPVVPLYFAKKRKVVVRGEMLIPLGDGVRLSAAEEPQEVMCRFRSLGCMPCSGAVRSEAATIEGIIEEMFGVKVSERATRIIDHDSDGSMETKKREGYF
jgi:sulfate adenylyltransferase subunit 2